jgi:hypothetical protein
MDILKVMVEFLAVTMLTILADRYLSNKSRNWGAHSMRRISVFHT